MVHSGLNVTQFFWLMLAAFMVALAARRAKVPYPLALVMTGLVIGVPHLLPHVHLDPSLVMYVFLPPLLFEAAINLPLTTLRREWKPIAIYTLAGTVASTFIVGGLVAWVLHIPLAISLVFGALISTTDPISVIAVFKRLGVSKRLSLIIEAESLFNNDTAVVLFTIVMAAVAGGSVSALHGVGQFFQLVIGGAILGVAIGLLASRIYYELDDHLVEITLTTVVAFGSYLAADLLHVSGVMAVVAAGIVIGNVGMPQSMSAGTRLAVSAMWEYAAFVVNSIVFLLIGIEVAYVHWTAHLGLVGVAIVSVLAGRAAIYPLSVLVNRLGGNIPPTWQHALFWGGLRGALSMALVLGLPLNFPYRDELVAATFGVVLFSLLAQGFTLKPLMLALGLTQAVRAATHQADPDLIHETALDVITTRAALLELERLRTREDYPSWAVELLTYEYRRRLDGLETDLGEWVPGFAARQAEHASDVRRTILTAQKSAVLDAVKGGHLDETAWKRIVDRVDEELLALQSEGRASLEDRA